jgi:hypothetical protein
MRFREKTLVSVFGTVLFSESPAMKNGWEASFKPAYNDY